MNKYKKLAANTAIFAIGSFGSKILAFLLTRIYTGYMDAGMFNTKEILEMCANLLIPVVSFSITDAVIRYGLDKNYEKKKNFLHCVLDFDLKIKALPSSITSLLQVIAKDEELPNLLEISK